MTPEEVTIFNPFFLKLNKDGVFVKTFYETTFYCNENKTIHKSKKEVLKCKHCMK